MPVNEDKRIQRLRCIREHRESLNRNGQETTKQIDDRSKDRIYHLAAVHQSRQLMSRLNQGGNLDLAILDRTPFVGWAYASARNPDSKYLEEIYAQNLRVARLIGLENAQIFLFDVSAEETYARSLARYFTGEKNAVEKMKEVLTTIDAPADVVAEIISRALEIIEIGTPKKPFENWHFPKYDFTKIHRQTFMNALLRGQKDMGYDLHIVDASLPPEHVLESVLSKVDLDK